MSDVEPSILRRIDRRLGVPDLAELLAAQLPGTDLQSLLMAVARRRAERVSPAELLRRYESDRFVHPSAVLAGDAVSSSSVAHTMRCPRASSSWRSLPSARSGRSPRSRRSPRTAWCRRPGAARSSPTSPTCSRWSVQFAVATSSSARGIATRACVSRPSIVCCARRYGVIPASPNTSRCSGCARQGGTRARRASSARRWPSTCATTSTCFACSVRSGCGRAGSVVRITPIDHQRVHGLEQLVVEPLAQEFSDVTVSLDDRARLRRFRVHRRVGRDGVRRGDLARRWRVLDVDAAAPRESQGTAADQRPRARAPRRRCRRQRRVRFRRPGEAPVGRPRRGGEGDRAVAGGADARREGGSVEAISEPLARDVPHAPRRCRRPLRLPRRRRSRSSTRGRTRRSS